MPPQSLQHLRLSIINRSIKEIIKRNKQSKRQKRKRDKRQKNIYHARISKANLHEIQENIDEGEYTTKAKDLCYYRDCEELFSIETSPSSKRQQKIKEEKEDQIKHRSLQFSSQLPYNRAFSLSLPSFFRLQARKGFIISRVSTFIVEFIKLGPGA